MVEHLLVDSAQSFERHTRESEIPHLNKTLRILPTIILGVLRAEMCHNKLAAPLVGGM